MNKQANISLVLKIQRSGKVNQKVITENENFTLGQSPDNDLTLFGQEYPKKHVLFEKRNGFFQLYLPDYIKDGEIRAADSVLTFKELIVHDILPRQKNNFIIRLSPRKQGYLTFGDTRIDFLFDSRKIARQVMPEFKGFSWINTLVKSLYSDLMFKSIFLMLLMLNMIILFLFKDYEVNVNETVDIVKVQKRFAKFIMKAPEEIMEVNTSNLTSNTSNDDEKESGSEKREKRKSSAQRNKRAGSRKRGGGNPAASAGLLSLIGGTGTGSKSNTVVDALVDKGLVSDLKNILGGGTNLKVGGKKTKDDIDPLDQLIGTGGSGGIDDFLASMDDDVAENKVTLKKQVRVNLAKATSKSGSAEALGYRSDQSVMSVVNARIGRITWHYEKYLKRQPNLRGKVTVQFTIAANGFVTSVKILESTIKHPQLEKDIVNLIKRLKFEPIPEGATTFVFPFHFKKM